MRLSEKDLISILKGIKEIDVLGEEFNLYLFGSRVDNKKLGGDIDLLLVVPQKIFNELSSKKHILISQSKKYIDDQKIDITLRAKESLKDDPFYLSIKNQLIKLN